jgi:hypothetical protein
LNTWVIEYTSRLELAGLLALVFVGTLSLFVGLRVIPFGKTYKKRVSVIAFSLTILSVFGICMLANEMETRLNAARQISLAAFLETNYDVVVKQETLKQAANHAVDHGLTSNPYTFEVSIHGEEVTAMLYPKDDGFILVKYEAVQQLPQNKF